MKTKDIFIRARKIITPSRKFGTGATYLNGRYCSIGALLYGAGARPHAGHLMGGNYRAFKRARDKFSDAIGGDIVRWNDNPERKHSEVLAAFDAAIKGCR